MYAVIFKAAVKTLDQEYFDTANKMRELAMENYGCLDFISSFENGVELAISYWPSKENIQAWHQDPEHQKAQTLGKTRWYRSYKIQVVEVLREYEGAAQQS